MWSSMFLRSKKIPGIKRLKYSNMVLLRSMGVWWKSRFSFPISVWEWSIVIYPNEILQHRRPQVWIISILCLHYQDHSLDNEANEMQLFWTRCYSDLFGDNEVIVSQIFVHTYRVRNSIAEVVFTVVYSTISPSLSPWHLTNWLAETINICE